MPIRLFARSLIQFGLILAAMTTSFGCVMATSRPLYDAKEDVVYNPVLIGRWANANGTLKFSQAAGNSYRIEGISRPDSSTDGPDLVAQMVRIGKYYYLFFADPARPDAGTRLYPCFRITVTPDILRLEQINVMTMARHLKAHPAALQHEYINPAEPAGTTQPDVAVDSDGRATVGNMILTDEPAAIREYFVQHQDDPGWVDQAIVLHKVKEFSSAFPYEPPHGS